MQPRHPWLAAGAVVIVVVLLLEGYVRLVENQFETLRAGDSAEMILKAARISEISQKNRRIGVVFFGNSMMDTAVSPAWFLRNSTTYASAYNAAVVGAPLQTRLRWSEEVVLRNLDPDLIVLGVHPIDLLHTDFLRINQDPQQADIIFGQVLRESDTSAVGALDRAVNDNLALVRNRGVLRRPRVLWDATAREARGQPKPKEFEVRTEADWRAMLKHDGEIAMFHGQPFKQASVKNTAPKIRENLRSSNFGTTELTGLLDHLQRTGRKVVVTIPPVPLTAWGSANVDVKALHHGNQLINDAAAAHGMPVIDFTDLGYKDALFGDVLHANEKGSLQFSKQLAQALDEL